MTKGVNVRVVILETLQEILENGQLSHLVLSGVLEKYQYLEKQERSFISRSVDGVMERLLTIDYILNQFSKTPVKKMKPFIRNLLRMSVYHLFYMDSVPDRAVVSEAVKLAEKKGFYGLKGFVNGVLRNIIRNKDAIIWPKDPDENLEVRYGVPRFIMDEVRNVLSSQKIADISLEEVLEGFLEKRPLCIRVNTNKVDAKTCKESLEKEGVTVKVHPYLSDCLEISGYDYLKKLTAFREGFFQVQDISSMLVGSVASALLPEDGVLLDVCSAPGGKSMYVAEHLPKATIISRDISDYKLSFIRENIEKSGVKNVKTEVFDATKKDEAMVKKADVVLADLPCSGLGILRKKRDIAYKTTKEDVESLAKLQRQILKTISDYVKVGGYLIFSTCTITQTENEENRKWFLENFSFEEVDITRFFAKELQEASLKEGYIQLLPGKHLCDGFYISVMKRV